MHQPVQELVRQGTIRRAERRELRLGWLHCERATLRQFQRMPEQLRAEPLCQFPARVEMELPAHALLRVRLLQQR